MLKTSDRGIALIQQFEGFRPAIYADTAGLPTVGYGHLVTSSQRDLFLKGITQDAAFNLLRADAGIAEQALARLIGWALNQNQFDALVSFTFNLGAGTLQRSTLRAVINRGELKAAPVQFQRYVWAGGQKQVGLVKRRLAEAALFKGF